MKNKERKHITDSEKDKVVEKLFERYNPVTIGNIEKYPPFGEHFVTLYFENRNFTAKCYYCDKVEENLYDFKISNVMKTENETNVTIRITKK